MPRSHNSEEQAVETLTAVMEELSQQIRNLNGRLDKQEIAHPKTEQDSDQETDQGNPESRFKEGIVFQRRNVNQGGPKIALEKFDPEKTRDIRAWLLQMETYFAVNKTPSIDMVPIASLHLYGRALNWYYWWKKMQGPQQEEWRNFRIAIINQYEDSWSMNYFAQLTRLQQTGSVREYTEQFQMLQCMVTSNIPQECLRETYISGLKAPIRFRVLAQQHGALEDIINHARCVEAELKETRPTFMRRTDFAPPSNTNWHRSGVKSDAPLAIKNTTENSTRQEHIQKGTCFKCGGKWNREHQCPGKKVFMLHNEELEIPEQTEEDTAPDQEDNNEQAEAELDELLEIDTENVQISLQAITGQSTAPQTL